MDVTALIGITDLVISRPLWWRCHTFPTFGNFQYIIFFSLSIKGCFTYYDQKSKEHQRDIREYLLSNDNHLFTSFYTFSLHSGMMNKQSAFTSQAIHLDGHLLTLSTQDSGFWDCFFPSCTSFLLFGLFSSKQSPQRLVFRRQSTAALRRL